MERLVGDLISSAMTHRHRHPGEESGGGYAAVGLVVTLLVTAIASYVLEYLDERPPARLVVLSEISDSQVAADSGRTPN